MAFGVVGNCSVQTNENKPYSQNESRNDNYGVQMYMFIGEVHFEIPFSSDFFLRFVFALFFVIGKDK